MIATSRVSLARKRSDASIIRFGEDARSAQLALRRPPLYSRRTPGDEDNVDANYDQAQEKALGMQPVPAVHVDINKERARTRLLAAFDGEHQDAERVAIMCVAGLFARERVS